MLRLVFWRLCARFSCLVPSVYTLFIFHFESFIKHAYGRMRPPAPQLLRSLKPCTERTELNCQLRVHAVPLSATEQEAQLPLETGRQQHISLYS